MFNEERCCGNCRYHWKHLTASSDDERDGEYWCANDMGDAYGDFTGFRDYCEEWEARA
ncbi:MAG: hypothetical protein LUC83_10060 [Clostridiales bacterium]|nr:hypothetical protein [Clostridiales bacterium]